MPTVHSTLRRSAAAEHAALMPIVIKAINDKVFAEITEIHMAEAAKFEAKPGADRSYDSTALNLVASEYSQFVGECMPAVYQGACEPRSEPSSPIKPAVLTMHSGHHERLSNDDMQKLVDDFYLGAKRQYDQWRAATDAPNASLICKVTGRMTELDNGGMFLTLAFWFLVAA